MKKGRFRSNSQSIITLLQDLTRTSAYQPNSNTRSFAPARPQIETADGSSLLRYITVNIQKEQHCLICITDNIILTYEKHNIPRQPANYVPLRYTVAGNPSFMLHDTKSTGKDTVSQSRRDNSYYTGWFRGKVNTLLGDSIGNWEKNSSYENVSNSEW